MIITMGFDLAKNIFSTFFQRMGQTKMAHLELVKPKVACEQFLALIFNLPVPDRHGSQHGCTPLDPAVSPARRANR